MRKTPPCSKAESAEHCPKFNSPLTPKVTSSFEENILKGDVKQSTKFILKLFSIKMRQRHWKRHVPANLSRNKKLDVIS